MEKIYKRLSSTHLGQGRIVLEIMLCSDLCSLVVMTLTGDQSIKATLKFWAFNLHGSRT